MNPTKDAHQGEFTGMSAARGQRERLIEGLMEAYRKPSREDRDRVVTEKGSENTRGRQ